jgi:nucleoside-diphosphate-sugar epimerase
MTRLLITGSTGFVGNNLIDHLFEKGFELSTLDRVQHKNKKIKHSYSWDKFTVENLQYTNVIIHLAGKAHDTKNVSDSEVYFTINVGLTKKIFDAFIKSDVRDFIYFSSVKAVADTVDVVLYEDAGYHATTPYGISKEEAEKYILSRQIGEGKRLFILRPCMIHGPGNKGNLNLLYKFVIKSIPYPLAAFQNSRSFLSVDNLTYLVEKLLTNQHVQSGIYNVSDDVPLSTNDIIAIVALVTGKKQQLWKIKPNLIKFAARLGDLLHLPLNSERLKKLTESYVVSNNKIKHALNIPNLPVSSTDGLKKTIQSFKLNSR